MLVIMSKFDLNYLWYKNKTNYYRRYNAQKDHLLWSVSDEINVLSCNWIYELCNVSKIVYFYLI